MVCPLLDIVKFSCCKIKQCYVLSVEYFGWLWKAMCLTESNWWTDYRHSDSVANCRCWCT